MSVINSVLRDLQQQRPALRAVDPKELREAPMTSASSGRRGRYGLLLLSLLLSGLVLWQQPWRSGESVVAAARTPPSPAEMTSAVGRIERQVVARPEPGPIAEQASVEDARPVLRGLQIREDDNSLVLSFQLSVPVVSYLRQQSGNAYHFVLKQTESRIETPRLEQNPWIQGLEIASADGDLSIRLQTTPGVRIETTEAEGVDGSSRWQLALHRRPVREAAATDAASVPASAETKAVSSETPGDNNGNPAIAEARPDREAFRGVSAAEREVQAAPNPDSKPSRLDIRSSPSKPEADVARQQRRKAHGLFRAGRYGELIRRFGSDPAQDDLLALAYQRLDRFQDSASAWRRLLQRNPADGRAWIGLALALEGLQQYPEARDAYRRARASGGLSPRLDAFAAGRLQTPGRVAPAATDRGDK